MGADQPNDVKQVGICLPFKECLKLRHVNTPFFSECLLFENTMQNKMGFIIITYKSPSQTADEFSKFRQN